MSAWTWFMLDGLCLYLTAKQMLLEKITFFFLLVLFSIIACKTNPNSHDVLLFGAFFLSGASQPCGVSLGVCVCVGVSGPVGKESVRWLAVISGSSGRPRLLCSPGVVVASFSTGGEIDLPGLPSVARLGIRRHLVRVTSSSWLGGHIMPHLCGLLQFWGLKPAHLPLPPFRVPFSCLLSYFQCLLLCLVKRRGQDKTMPPYSGQKLTSSVFKNNF